jgi:hypothetical protein
MFIVEKVMVEKFMVEKFMVEKFMVEKFWVEMLCNLFRSCHFDNFHDHKRVTSLGFFNQSVARG